MNIPVQILADLPSLGINPNEWTAGCASAVGPWIAGGIGLGVVIVAVLVGWAKLRQVAEDERYHEEYEQREAASLEYLADMGDADMEAVAADAEFGESLEIWVNGKHIEVEDVIDSDELTVDEDQEEGE
jgi:hypothetical protein